MIVDCAYYRDGRRQDDGAVQLADVKARRGQGGEISVFVAPDFVITVRQGTAGELRPARQRLEQRPGLLAAGSAGPARTPARPPEMIGHHGRLPGPRSP
jgi:hypothetical protein